MHKKKYMYPIMFASGMAGIGKTVFGQHVLKEIVKNDPESEFGLVLSNMNYLMVDFRCGGNNFVAEDIPLTSEQRFLVRVLSGACRIPDGASGLRSMLLAPGKYFFNAHVAEMSAGGLNNVASILIQYSQGRVLFMKDILGAMAADIRKASGNKNAKVGMWLHFDEHQIYYNDIKDYLGFDEAKMLEEHKAFLYPAIEILSSGWCFDNNIFCVPFFTGTNHYCLKKLFTSTGHRGEYIQLGPLSLGNSRIVVLKTLSTSSDVHESWLNPVSPGGILSPFDILCQEVHNVPRYLEHLGRLIIVDELKSPYTSTAMIALLEKIGSDQFVGVLTEKCKYTALASICGMKLSESQWEDLGYHDTTPYAILEPVDHQYRLLINPAVLAKSAEVLRIPIPFGDFLNIPVPTPPTLLWEEVVASRFSAVLTVQRKLGYSSITLTDLLGPHFHTIADRAKHFNTTFRMPESDGVFINMLPMFRNSTSPEATIEPIIQHLKAFVTRGKSAFVDFANNAIGMFNTDTEKKHPLADIVVAVEVGPMHVMLMFVSVKGPKEIATLGSRLLSKLKVKRDVEALFKAQRELEEQLNSPTVKHRISLLLVYVLSKEQSEEELCSFRDLVNGLECNDISVAVVSDMTAFLPPFAHRLSFSTEITLREKFENVEEKGM